ncbi:MAG: NADH-quinone oxidoreductase subunit L [Planctomycetota bacterium]|nr:MAG: NADH-quinone oxidoreductase subunit L [Planctomycetota bacterium]
MQLDNPGLLYVAATLLPLASFVLLLLAGALRSVARPYRDQGGIGASLYETMGGDRPQRTGAYVATAAIGLAFVLSLVGFIYFVKDHGFGGHREGAHAVAGGQGGGEAKPAEQEGAPAETRWANHLDFANIALHSGKATVLTLGYYIDSLSAIMFLMVTLIATLIHVFSIGYMSEELTPVVEDHQVHTEHGPLQRRGRFGRFFLYMSLFCFSMLNLVLADNLFQVFISWELVGVCSYLLIGFYYERRSASNAANKAFITNRVGDAGFLIGLLILWTYLGTFNFQDIFRELPQRLADGSLPHWIWVVTGLGIFLGCVGKSAQFPLHVWLPDAMEGPTPVSALIHAATMVAAGVYLVARVYPLFSAEARLVIAYTGAITLFVAATIAIVMTDIKKVLAYSTVSQLGYMMLALGVGGWVAGIFHLLTHAFFKALLFLCSGSVIYGCHHEQEMTKMGGLYPKMKTTALTMMAGVLAIGGIPLFSGWYSKDAILAQALGFFLLHKEHFLLFLLPLVTAGLTAFYMFRMWFMTFTGKPRDEHVYEHAHESPRTMTVPLIILAVCSIMIAWGMPPWQAELSYLGGHEGLLQMSEPTAPLESLHLADRQLTEYVHENHMVSERLAYVVGGLGLLFAALLYYWRVLDPADAKVQFAGVHRFLWHKWYFDELYSAILVRPALTIANWCRVFDTRVIDGLIDNTGKATIKLARWDGIFDNGVVDGLVNVTGRVIYASGARLRNLQTGFIRSYILFLVLAAIAIFFVLSYFLTLAQAGP